jgi:hypothetical protein
VILIFQDHGHWNWALVAFDGAGIEVFDGWTLRYVKEIGARARAMSVQLCLLAGLTPVPDFTVRSAPGNGQRQRDGHNCGYVVLLDVAEYLVGNPATATTHDAARLRPWVFHTVLELSTMATELDGVPGCVGAPVLPSIERHLSQTWGWAPPVMFNLANQCASVALVQVLAAVPALASSVVGSTKGSHCEVVMAFRAALLKLQSIEGTDAHMDVAELHDVLVAATMRVAGSQWKKRKKASQATPGHHNPHDLLGVLVNRLGAARVYALGTGVVSQSSVCGACGGFWADTDAYGVYSVELVLPQAKGSSLAKPAWPAKVKLPELLAKWGAALNTPVACCAPKRGGDAQRCVYGGCDTNRPTKSVLRLQTVPGTLCLIIQRRADSKGNKIMTAVRPVEILDATSLKDVDCGPYKYELRRVVGTRYRATPHLIMQ